MEYLDKLIYSIIAALVGLVGWLFRTVLTNQKQIELLQTEVKNRDERRKRDREDLVELKSDVKELRNDIKNLFQRN